MAFIAKKIEMDLELDLTMYIPGEAGKLNSTRKTAGEIFEWSKFSGREADKVQALRMDGSNEKMIEESRGSLIRQIDWFYGKGPKYWESIPLPELMRLITHLRTEVTAAEKKS